MLSVKKICKGIYLFSFDDQYQLCMHFLRYQEMYESPSSLFYDTDFKIIDFMEWYAKEYGNGAFTYPNDWAGFNVPGKIILEACPLDENKYDHMMRSLTKYCEMDHGGNDFYVIGTKSRADYDRVLEHEIAHGLYFTNIDYKRRMSELVDKLPGKLYHDFAKTLKGMMYRESVIADEIQAYMSTGLLHSLENPKRYKKHQKAFKDVFDQYHMGVKLDGKSGE